MGGYSEKCPFCGKWYINPRAIKDHVNGKHPKEYALWKINTGRVPQPKRKGVSTIHSS